jgi:hypothetical protein
MTKKIFEIFTDTTGAISSKRFCAIACVVAGIVYCFVRPTSDAMILGSLFGTGLSLLGISAITKT